MKEGYCSKKIMQGFYSHQCSRKAWKDGYCKQHHPDIVRERQRAEMEAYLHKINNSPTAIQRRKLEEKTKQCEELADALQELLGAVDEATWSASSPGFFRIVSAGENARKAITKYPKGEE